MNALQSELRGVLDVFRGNTPEQLLLVAEVESSRREGVRLEVSVRVFIAPRPPCYDRDRLDRALDSFPRTWKERTGCTGSDTGLRIGGLRYAEELSPQQFAVEQDERVRGAGHCVPPVHDAGGVTSVTRTIRVLMFPDTRHANEAACEAQGTDLAVPVEYTVRVP